ncbi:LuxR C-terminal-related transcriptional regulator [Paraglaciecola sp.]|uniref:LuxR C-terminal-related transcriptional regulator n=1 Tax=Paraglaciecola sp. TaxID=1920173 RepID=UPI003EF19DF4
MKIAIADDHNLMRAGFKSLLTALGHDVIAEVDDIPALAALMSDADVDLLVSDFDMPGGELLPLLEEIRLNQPHLKIIILTGLQYAAVFQQVLASQANVQGLLSKSVDPDVMQQAITTVSQGGQFIQQEISQLLQNSAHDLTKRERQVLNLLAIGRSNTEVANELFLSIKTVDSHRMNLMRKLEVRNIVQLIERARELGLTGL